MRRRQLDRQTVGQTDRQADNHPDRQSSREKWAKRKQIRAQTDLNNNTTFCIFPLFLSISHSLSLCFSSLSKEKLFFLCLDVNKSFSPYFSFLRLPRLFLSAIFDSLGFLFRLSSYFFSTIHIFILAVFVGTKLFLAFSNFSFVLLMHERICWPTVLFECNRQ